MDNIVMFPTGHARGLDRQITARCKRNAPMPIEAIFEPEPDSEVSLYRAILLQVVIDIASNSNESGTLKRKQEAELWLTSSMFEQVCSAAGYTTDYVVSRINAAKERDFQWRAVYSPLVA